MSGFRIDVDLSGLGMDQLADGAEAAVRPSAQAGAQVFYDRVKANVTALGKKTGNLSKSIYQVYSKDNSGKAVAQYHISWNQKKAPHGHLVEFGHVQRYVTYIDKRGEWKTAIRESQRLKGRKGYRKPPKRNAPQAVKDAYYVPLKGGPRIVSAKSFIRSTLTPANQRQARNAMVDRWWWELEQRGLL